MENKINAILETIHQRTSICQFENQKITRDQLETLVKEDISALSVVKALSCRFIVIDEYTTLKKIDEGIKTSKAVAGTPITIFVVWRYTKEGWIQDCSTASQNILLATKSMELGTLWTSVFSAAGHIKTVADILGLPDYALPLDVILVCNPKTQKEAIDKWNLENLNWNAWA